MKKTILILLSAITLSATAGNPESVLFKKESVNIFKKERTYNSGKSAGTWLAMGGGALFLGSMCKLVAEYQTEPIQTKYANDVEYLKAYNHFGNTQRALNGSFYIGVGVAGLCTFFAGMDLLNTPLHDGEKTTLRFKAKTNGIGLCLNFK